MNRKFTFSIVILVALLAIGYYYGQQQIWNTFKGASFFAQIKKSASNVDFLPNPLRGSFNASHALLTQSGVVAGTNEQRTLNGALPLHVNEKLNKAAEAKLNDMFAQQYFEHNSPQGLTPADVIKKNGYEYVVVGENLALGNFQNDQLLVEAWMNSPGHRENILHTSFQEIGVAVGKGMFEGKEVWLAVQEFGTPLSFCPAPPVAMQKQIDGNRVQIETWQNELVKLKNELVASTYNDKQSYDAAVEIYNNLASKTNALVQNTRTLVETYNSQVTNFNQCLEHNA